jgi:hypothetical protein
MITHIRQDDGHYNTWLLGHDGTWWWWTWWDMNLMVDMKPYMCTWTRWWTWSDMMLTCDDDGHEKGPWTMALSAFSSSSSGYALPCRLAFLLPLQSVRDGIRQRRCASEGHECCCSGSTTIEHLYRSVETPCRWVDCCFGFCFFIGRGGGENCLDSVRFLAPQRRGIIIVILLWRSFFSTRARACLSLHGDVVSILT